MEMLPQKQHTTAGGCGTAMLSCCCIFSLVRYSNLNLDIAWPCRVSRDAHARHGVCGSLHCTAGGGQGFMHSVGNQLAERTTFIESGTSTG
jgi:hypothetical protein